MILRGFSVISGDPLNWKNAFLILAVRRCSPFFEAMGLPQEIVRHPAWLRVIARSFLTADGAVETSDLDEYVRQKAVLRANAFDRIAEDYSGDVAQILADWMARYFVDQDQVGVWQAWGRLLPKLSGAYHHESPPAPSRLPSYKMERFRASVHLHFNTDVRKREESMLMEARSLPLDDEEQQWVVMTGVKWEMPTDLLGVQSALRWERTFQVLRDLETWLSPDERDILVTWAREFSALGSTVLPEHVRLPNL